MASFVSDAFFGYIEKMQRELTQMLSRQDQKLLVEKSMQLDAKIKILE